MFISLLRYLPVKTWEVVTNNLHLPCFGLFFYYVASICRLLALVNAFCFSSFLDYSNSYFVFLSCLENEKPLTHASTVLFWQVCSCCDQAGIVIYFDHQNPSGPWLQISMKICYYDFMFSSFFFLFFSCWSFFLNVMLTLFFLLKIQNI
jgi:hypothetical protein